LLCMIGINPIFYSFCLYMYVMYTPWYLCIFYYILYFKYYDTCWRFSDLSVVVFQSCDFHMPKYLRQGTESLCPMETGQWHFTTLLYKQNPWENSNRWRRCLQFFIIHHKKSSCSGCGENLVLRLPISC
jgi:hypothetical protein